MQFTTTHNSDLNETIFEGTHESGLKVIVMPKEFHKSYAIIGTKYGSINDNINDKKLPDGIAHFLEHKLFEQPDGTNAFDSFSKTGANSNAFTSFTNTCYLFSSTSDFDENLKILLEFVFHPHFTNENVAKEQGIIGQEIKMYEDDPNWQVFFNMLGLMYQNQPLSTDIAGTIESISHITPEVLNECYSHFYSPNNMVLAIVGNVTLDEIENCIPKLENKNTKISNIFLDSTIDLIKEKSVKLPVSSPLFLLGFRDKPEGDTQKKEAISELALELLFGQSTEFYQKAYEQGLINDSFSTESAIENNFAYVAIGGESPNPKKFKEEVSKFLSSKIDFNDADIKSAKNYLVGNHLKQFNSVERIGHALVNNAMRNTILFDYFATCEKITKNDVISYINSVITPDNMVLSIVEPI